MFCPACHGAYKKIQLDDHLLGKSCTGCEGVSFTLRDYLHYLSRSEPVDDEQADNDENCEVTMQADTKKAVICTCGHIMNKFRMNHETDRRVDYCSACHTIWLDKGEWEYLKINNWHHRINKLFTDSYQRQIRLDGTKQVLNQNYKKKLGAENYEHIKIIRNWIYKNPDKDLILSYLNAKNPYSAIK